MTPRQTRLNRSINWNTAIAESRVVKHEHGFTSYATVEAAAEASRVFELCGIDANIVDPSKAVR